MNSKTNSNATDMQYISKASTQQDTATHQQQGKQHTTTQINIHIYISARRQQHKQQDKANTTTEAATQDKAQIE